MYYMLLQMPLGCVGLLRSHDGVRRLILPGLSAEAVQAQLLAGAGHAVNDEAAFGDLPRRLERYFERETVSFPDNLDLDGTPFQQAVWEAARAIPYGETRSYGWVAGRLGRPGAARAVGQALGRNPAPLLVPCHRVTAAGGLGGFGAGTALKRFLLEMEARGLRASGRKLPG